MTVGRMREMVELYIKGQIGRFERINPVLFREVVNIKLREFLRDSGYVMSVQRLTSVANQQEYQLPTTLQNVIRCDVDGVEAVKIAYALASDMSNTTSYSATSATVTESNPMYVWKRVAITDTTDKQLLITGSGQLITDNMDSVTALPTFTTTDDYAIMITRKYQDRDIYFCTDEYVTAGQLAFGVRLSSVGTDGTCYFDVTIKDIT